jgi:predicted nucleic acid-binding protein
VLAWVAAQPRGLVYTTHINQAEILYGIGTLAEGRARTVLAAAATAMFAEDLAGRILPFEAGAAARYPEIVLARRRTGYPIEKCDALIAATALAAGARIATRDTGGFAGCSLMVIDPWTAS